MLIKQFVRFCLNKMKQLLYGLEFVFSRIFIAASCVIKKKVAVDERHFIVSVEFSRLDKYDNNSSVNFLYRSFCPFT